MLTDGQQPHGVSRAGQVRRVATGAAARAAWERAVTADDSLAVTQRPHWLDCMVAARGYRDATRLYRTADGRDLVLPMVARGRPARYDSWPSLWDGGLDNGGLLSADGPITPDDVRGVVADLRASPGLRMSVTPSATDAQAWRDGVPDDVERTRNVTYSVDVSAGFEASWDRRVSKSERYKARKAERLGVQVESDSTGRLLPVIDELYQTSVEGWARDYPLPNPLARPVVGRRYPHAVLVEMARILGPACRVWIAWRDGVPLAGIVVFSQGSAATYYKGATDKERVRTLSASTLLHREAIRAACVEGRSRYELGGSGLASLTQFKLSLGAQPVETFTYRFERLPVSAAERNLRSAVKRTLTSVSQKGEH